jgi:hypothetical protein
MTEEEKGRVGPVQKKGEGSCTKIGEAAYLSVHKSSCAIHTELLLADPMESRLPPVYLWMNSRRHLVPGWDGACPI